MLVTHWSATLLMGEIGMIEKQADYNRRYLAKLYQQFRSRKDQIAEEQFGGRCFLCGSTEGNGHEFHLHHISYETAGEHRNTKAMWTRELRLREAEEHPERFRLLCGKCHRLITTVGTYLLRRWQPFDDKAQFDKFLELCLIELINRQPDINLDLDRYVI